MSPESHPLVSIAMPVYNCAATLGTAIRSIVNQTFLDWELLVLDDGSSDNTVNMAQCYSDPRVRVFCDEAHRGLVPRLNQAIDHSVGKYFARMDGDDVCYPERLALQVEFLEQHPEVNLLGGGMLIFGQGGQIHGTREVRITHKDICRRPWSGFYLAHPTWMGTTQWFRKHYYRSDAVRSEDQDLLLRTYQTSHFANLPDILVGYREESVSLRKSFVGRCSFCRSLLREAIERKHYLVAARGVMGQTLKGLVDVLAVTTGLNYRVLRHRAMPVDRCVRERWAEVWTKLHEAEFCAAGEIT